MPSELGKNRMSTANQAALDAMAAYFSRVAETFNLPRSVAAIYHTLFVAEEALSFTQIVENSGLSKASASTGLKLLERMLAVEVVHIPNDRNTYYRPELSMRRLLTGFIEESLQPGLEAGQRLLDKVDTGGASSDLSPVLAERLASLRRWHEMTRDLLPALSALDPG